MIIKNFRNNVPRSLGKQRTVQIKSDLYSTKNVCCHETLWNSLRVLIKFRGIARIVHNIDQLSLGSVQKMMFVSVFMHVFLHVYLLIHISLSRIMIIVMVRY